MHRAANGVPRLLNILGHKALLAAYGEGKSRVGARHVRAAIRDTESLSGATSWHSRWHWALNAIAIAMIAGLSAVVWGHWQ
jgi:MSHA biogenesis protein MshM